MARAGQGGRAFTRFTGGAAAVVLIAGIVSALVVDREPDHPEEWDPRVAALADFVAAERDHEFEHPVYVDFLSEDDFRREVTTEESELSDEDRAGLEQGVRLLRATGLVSGDFDLFASGNQLSGEGTLAYYDPHTERITVRGNELTVGLRATLVHELTHVLQDQHFDLSRLGELPTLGENTAFQGVVEGDAIRMESAWAAKLDPGEQEQLATEMAAEAEGADIAEIPGALVAFFSAPYALGAPFVDAVFAEEGQQRLDEALRTPPTSEEQLLDPYVYLEDDEPVPVDEPALAEGDERIDASDFGSLSWFLVLAERIDPRQSLTAVDGWGGDSSVIFEREGRTCLRSAFRGDTEADTEEMAAALEAWVAAAPGNASVSRPEGLAVLESCDPGPEAPSRPEGGARDAIVYPVTRTYFTVGATSSGASRDVARCTGTAFVKSFTAEELIALGSALPDPSVIEERSREAAAACR